MSPIAALPLGFLCAMALIPRILHWSVLLHAAFTKQSGDFLRGSRRRLLWITPFVLLGHPVPYLIVALGVVTVLGTRGALAPGWLWFLAGFYVYASLAGAASLRALVLMKKARRARGGAP